MDQTIRNADFMHTEDDDQQHAFTQSHSDWDRNSENISFAELQACFKAIQAKVCRSDFPPEGTSGYYMAYHLLRTLIGIADDLVEEGRAQAADIQEMYLEFILGMIQAGPLSSHSKYIYLLMDDSQVEFSNFYQSLRGDRLKSIVLSLKKEYKPDTGMEVRSFFSHHFDHFWRVVVSDGFSDEQFEEARYEFLELYTYFRRSFTDREEEMCKAMHNLCWQIELKYDRNIYQGIKDISVLKEQLAIIGKQILDPRFPQMEEVGKEAKDDLQKLLKVVSQEGLLRKLYEGIMDLALDLTIKKAGCEGTRQHFEAIGYFFFHLKEESVQGDKELFDGLMPQYVHFLHSVRDEVYLTYRFVKPVMYDCLNKAMGKSAEHIRQWIDMIKAVLKYSIPECLETAYRAMREKEDDIKWKKYPDDIKEIFALLSVITFPPWLAEKQLEEGQKQLKDLTKKVLDEAKKVGIVKLGLTEPILEFAFHSLEQGTEASYSLADALVDVLAFNPKKDKALMMNTIERVTTYLEDESYDWEDNKIRDLGYALRDIITACIDSVKDGKVFTWEEYDELIYLVKLSERKLALMSEPTSSIFYVIFMVVGMNVSRWLQTMNETHRLIPLVPSIMTLLDVEDDTIQSTCSSFMMMLSHTTGALFARYNHKLLDKFLEEDNDDVLSTLIFSYEFNPGPVEERFDALFEHVDSGNISVRSSMVQLLAKVAKLQPHLFDQEKVDVVIKEAKEDATQQAVLLMILADIAKRRIDLLEPSMDDFMDASLWQPMSAHAVITILQLYGLGSEEKADRVITYLMERIQTSGDQTEVLCGLQACRLLGFKHRPAIEKHRGTIENFMGSTSDTNYHSGCTAILDMLDGKSVDKITEELRELQGDVADLEVRVTATENDIVEVKDTVEQQGQDLDNVKNDVTEQGQRLDSVQTTVDDTVAKVQEIDSKTLSHAPCWARDVSRLLNVEGDADWRLLSLRLGYSNDDIRAWATQADPCMHLLNEWFTTHKTREATHAILTSLQLLDREDAAVIVENAMKKAEEVVEDEEFEYATPPDVFLSYQWGHQDEVRLLRQHLEMAGFSCWMDVGQMGGGDKLFEKIDTGIRGAKVVISCVTAKYAKSPNCNREVNLSVNLGKPMIPLLMEKTSWPPPGSMGPVFSEYLFIRFFQRAGEETRDQRYWPLPKFQELLMQLSVNGLTPDQQVVQPEYQDWWLPKVEEVKIDKDRAKKQTAAPSAPSSDSDDKTSESPEVFISYQWGKQPQILKLYRTLTALGYSCWLDIMQMGGGDSLYDKIDRGLRGCRLVLSCITTKYAKSANCRREVSLADAVQKPLIPLLLETVSWPPPGPMSPILTQLLYIDCTKNNMEETWDGPKFEELLDMIDRHLPGKCREKSPEPQRDKQQEPEPEPSPAAPQPPAQRTQAEAQSPVAAPPPSPPASAPYKQEAVNGDQEESTRSRPAPPPDQPPCGEKGTGGAEAGRRTSVASSSHSVAGHDGYNTTHVGPPPKAKSSCCLIM